MKISCIVPPLQNMVNELGHGYLPPLGLLSVAGPLVDNGFAVDLVDADAGHLTHQDIIDRLKRSGTTVALIGHSGSMAANPAALRLIADIKDALPYVTTVYGGVYPTFAHREILSRCSAVDFIVTGEGEEVTLALMNMLRTTRRDFIAINGLAWRSEDGVVTNDPSQPICDLNRHRVAWELADWSLYQGRHFPGRNAVVQFSRGCPHACSFCGQWMFWKQWRHRNIERFVSELLRLRDQYDVRTVWIADENWACNPSLFHSLLEAIADRELGLHIFCAACAADVVRDEAKLAWYRRAGIVCLMMGVESFDATVLGRVGKDNDYSMVCRAVELLRQHGILSVVNVIHGFRDETWRLLWQTVRQLHRMLPDFYNALHLTPLSWTKEGRSIDHARIIEFDQSKWDFRHPVIQPAHFSPRGLALAVKLTEALFYLHPAWLTKGLFTRDPVCRRLLLGSFTKLASVYRSEFQELWSAANSVACDVRLPSEARPGSASAHELSTIQH